VCNNAFKGRAGFGKKNQNRTKYSEKQVHKYTNTRTHAGKKKKKKRNMLYSYMIKHMKLWRDREC